MICSRTKIWSCYLPLRCIMIKTNIYNFICIQQGAYLRFNMTIIADICQIMWFLSTHQLVIFNGYLWVQVPTGLSVSFFDKKIFGLIISPWNAIHLVCFIALFASKKITFEMNFCDFKNKYIVYIRRNLPFTYML